MEGGSAEATEEKTLILELAIARSRASGLDAEEPEARIHAPLEKAGREILGLVEHGGDRADLFFGEKEAAHACASARTVGATDRNNRGSETDLSRYA